MMGLKISDAADATGFSADTLRYYERIGLVRPSSRTDSGYRQYSEADIESLDFVGHAKTAGLSLDDIRELVALRSSGDCGPVRDRLHELVCARAAATRTQSFELSDFAARLDELGSRLTAASPTVRCGPDCACTTPLPESPSAGAGDVLADACVLPTGEIPDRLDAWRSLMSSAVSIEPHDDGFSARFEPDPTMAARAAELATLEQGCCGSALSFQLTPGADSIELRITGRGSADALALLTGGVASN